MLGGGGFVVTWSSDGPDGSGYGVYGQRYNATGAPVGGEFKVNTYTTDSQFAPRVAGLGGGGFVVTWISFGQDGSGTGIYGQRYSAAGSTAGSEFKVNTYTAGWQNRPSVAGLGGGGYVVTWSSWEQDGSEDGVYGQRYNATGAPVGGEFKVNTYTTDSQLAPSVAGLGGGGFVVTWSSWGQDGSEYGIYGQRYSPSGARR
jgi:hypothetical protein